MKRTLIALMLGFILTLSCGVEKTNNTYGKYTRAELRYYAYAPPFIPHPVLNPQCLDCHEQGLIVEGFKAPVTPHPQLENCQQCHIPIAEDIEVFKENNFVGMPEPKKLEKPQPAGPSLIPHRVFMREDCLVCHNDSTRTEIIQTTHPERLNCLQCHVPQNLQVREFLADL